MDISLYYNAIAIAAHSGYATIKKYYTANGGDWKAAYEALRRDAAADDAALRASLLFDGGATPADRPMVVPDPREAYERMEALGVRLALHTSPEFPEALRHIPYPPFGIYLRGAALPDITQAPSTAKTMALAIVGTRRASDDGKRVTRSFARDLAAAGFTIVSGLAFGIDAAAHNGTLDAGGTTVAVLAGGLDGVYPHSHRGLAEKILASGGTLASEYPPGEPPFGYRFIERNRIISGVSRGVLVVEAPESSGALATARYAVEQNREVFVVPGSVSTSGFKGSHALIRQGAELVTSPDDIFDAYSINKRERVAAHANTSSPEEILILRTLAEINTPADVDKLITLTRLEPRVVNQTLSVLLLRGNIKETERGYTI